MHDGQNGRDVNVCIQSCKTADNRCIFHLSSYGDVIHSFIQSLGRSYYKEIPFQYMYSCTYMYMLGIPHVLW